MDKSETRLGLLDDAVTVNKSSSLSVGEISIIILLSSSFTKSGSSIELRTGISLIFSTVKVNCTISEIRPPSSVAVILTIVFPE